MSELSTRPKQPVVGVEMPHEYPAGIEYVIVNGVVALAPKGVTGSRPGYLLRRQAAR